ncbi:MAG: hypothetical protein ACKVT2_21770, partial [Saprospiraceae bacterium]
VAPIKRVNRRRKLKNLFIKIEQVKFDLNCLVAKIEPSQNSMCILRHFGQFVTLLLKIIALF